MIFGGGETYSRRPPAYLAGFVRKHLARIYPQLAAVPVDHAWGGTLAITLNRLPFIKMLRPGVYVAQVRSIANAQQSTPVVVTVAAPQQ